MFKLAELFVEVTARTGGVSAALAGLHGKLLGLGPLGTRLSGTIHGATQAYLGLGAAGPIALAACGAAAAALAVGMAHVAFEAAHLTEAVAKVEQAFGSSSGRVMATADDLARRFGAVRKEVLDTAASFGLMLQGAGVERALSADMSAALSRVAVDAASYFDVEMSEAITRLQSGLSGEMEAVRRWGINLSESNVQLKARGMGFKKPDDLDQGTKTLIRYKLIMEGLTAAQGDAERSSGRLIGQWKLFTGQVSELGTTLGGLVVPFLTNTLWVLNGVLGVVLRLADAIGAVAKGLLGWGGAIVGIDVFGEQAKARDLAAIDQRIDRVNAGMKADEAKAKAMDAADKAEKHEPKGWRGGLEEWARHIQEGAWGKQKDKVEADQLATQKAMEGLLRDIRGKLSRPQPVIV